MDDLDRCWDTFAAGMRKAQMLPVVEKIQAKYNFGGIAGVKFGDMLLDRVNVLYAKQPNARYWAPEIMQSWLRRTKSTAMREVYSYANSAMSTVLEARVISGELTDDEAKRFAQHVAPPILETLLSCG